MKRLLTAFLILVINVSLLAACSGTPASQDASSSPEVPSPTDLTTGGSPANGAADDFENIATIDIVIEALQNPDEWVVIDVRTAEEYDGKSWLPNAFGSGRLKGSVNVDRELVFDSDGELLPHDELASLYEFIGDRKAIVYCHGGLRSAFIRDILVDLGFDTWHYSGSWVYWSWAASIASDYPSDVVLSLTEEWTDNEGEI